MTDEIETPSGTWRKDRCGAWSNGLSGLIKPSGHSGGSPAERNDGDAAGTRRDHDNDNDSDPR